MFLPWYWSALLLLVPVLIYVFIIRPRLEAKLTELYADIDSFWGRLKARLYAFRTQVVAAVGILLAAAPDILVAVAPLDFSPYIGQDYAKLVGLGTAVTMAVMNAFKTKPGETK